MRSPGLVAPYRLGLPRGAINEVALRLDRPKDELLIHRPTPRLPQGPPRRAVFPERDRGTGQIGRPRLDNALLCQHENAREIARVVFQCVFAGFLAHQPAQFVRPITNMEEMKAIALQNPLLRGQEVDQELTQIGGHADLGSAGTQLPGR